MDAFQDASTVYKNRRRTGRVLDKAVTDYFINNSTEKFHELNQAVRAYDFWLNRIRIKNNVEARNKNF